MKALLDKIKHNPETLEFAEVMAVIDANYTHTPSAFVNGDQINSADQNQGSCKILAFAQDNHLTEAQTLACFGRYYREDVLQHPDATDHGNIRAFMRTGWSGVDLPVGALVRK